MWKDLADAFRGRAARVALGLFLAWAILWLGLKVLELVRRILEPLSDILIPLLFGFAIAYILGPLVDRLERLGVRRGLAILTLLVVVVLLLAGFVFLALPAVAQELSVLAEALNASQARLAGLVRRTERQRDEFETLYHFTDQLSRAVRPEERRLRAVDLATQFLGAECVLVQAEYLREARTGAGTITLRGTDGFEDHAFRFGPDSQEGVPSFLSNVIERWLKGEFDDRDEVKEGWIVGYPVQREGGRHLGLLLLPVAHSGETEGEAPDPDLVRALCSHIAIAIEFSGMQTELVGQERLAAIGEGQLIVIPKDNRFCGTGVLTVAAVDTTQHVDLIRAGISFARGIAHVVCVFARFDKNGISGAGRCA